MKTINSLPELPMLTIFGKLALEELIAVGCVCKLWRSYREKITPKVRSVTLLIGKKPLELITEGSFVVEHLDEVRNEDGKPMFPSQFEDESTRLSFKKFDLHTVKFILPILSGVTSLSIAINGIPLTDVIRPLTCLLYQMSSKLISLKLYFCFPKGVGRFANEQYHNMGETDPNSNTVRNTISAENIIKLLGTINDFPVLEHLTLDFQQALGYAWNELMELDFSIIHRLREFYIFTLDSKFNHIFDDWLKIDDKKVFLKEHQDCRLERIGALIRDRDLCVLINFGRNHPLGGKFNTIAPIDLRTRDETRYYNKTLSKEFLALTTLAYHYYPKDDHFFTVLKVIAPLKQLISLTLIVHGMAEPEVDGGPSDIFAMGFFRMMRRQSEFEDFPFSLSKFDRLEQDKFPQLSSVRILTLEIRAKRHADMQSRHWGWIFPNVQVLVVKHDCLGLENGVADCEHYSDSSRRTGRDGQFLAGIRQLLGAFKDMPKLHTVHTNFPVEKKWTREQIQD